MSIEVEKMKNKTIWNVKLDNRVVGKIHYENMKFQYFPKGSHVGGEKFDYLNRCIASLYAPEESET